MGERANGEGSLYQRKSDGRWVGAVIFGFDDTGRPKRKTVSAKSRAEAWEKLKDLHNILDSGLPPPDDQLRLGAFFDSWLTHVVPLRVSPATLANYRSVFETHIKPGLGRKRLRKLQPDDVQRFIHAKLEQGLSTRTVRLIRGLLVQALDHAVRQGHVVRNVAALTDGPRQQAGGDGRSLTIKQAKLLLKAAKGDRLECLYILMLATGMRPGEAFGLPWKNVDLKKGQVVVRQALVRQPGGSVIGAGKTDKKGWRTIQLPASVVGALNAHRIRQAKERSAAKDAWEDHRLVFCTQLGRPLDPDNHRKAFAELTELAGIGRWHPHELRHSATSIMLAQGVPIEVVSKILGHTSIRITADVYGHILDQQNGAAAMAMESALWT